MYLIDDVCRELDFVDNTDQIHIHRLRVDIKKLRAWTRLIQDMPGVGNLKDTDKYLRNIAQQFSYTRDLEIIPETIDWLKRKAKRKDETEALNKISQHIQYQEFPPPLNQDCLISIDRDFFSGLRQKSIKVDIHKIIKAGLKNTDKKTMQHGKKALSEKGTLKDLHRLRKWVKFLYYQIGFIQASFPCYCQNEHRLLDKLGKQLGRIHDLDVLRRNLEKLENECDCADAVRTTNKLIEKRIKKLQKRSKVVFRKVFVHPREYLMTAK